MRFTRSNQLWLEPSREESLQQNEMVRELSEMAGLLSELPALEEVLERVRKDLVGKKRTDCGKTGLTAEQALRAALVKEKLSLTYRQLEFYLSDSVAIRSFVCLEPHQIPKKSVLNRDIRLIKGKTWEFFNEQIRLLASSKGIEDGAVIRADTTATETNIHHPTDASLLWDGVRVLTRLMRRADERLPGLTLEFCDHTRRVRKRLYGINNARGQQARLAPYRDLINVSERVREYAKAAVGRLSEYVAPGVMEAVLAQELRAEIARYLGLFEQVIAQTIRRVLNGESVPAAEKVVSIFEPHTDIIEKGGRETVFGHKVCVSSGKSGMILDCQVLEGNRSDSSLVKEILSRHEKSYGTVPHSAAFDGGFASNDNMQAAKKKGVEHVVFSKTRGADLEALRPPRKIFKALSNFRAGIEAGISALKRAYGFSRVIAKGLRAFKTSLLNGVAAFNLTLLARSQLRRA